MSISNRLLGKKNVNGHPHIEAVTPAAALPGGEVRILGSGFRAPELRRPQVRFGEKEGSVVISADDFVVARVPEGVGSSSMVISTNGHSSNAQPIKVATAIAENLHPVANPALDVEGNIYVTFSGSRGQKVPVSIFKIDTNYNVKPFLTDMMNATAIAFDRGGQMYVTSRFDGAVYRVAPNGTMTAYAESMGVATGLAFDREQNLYVGDRSGTIFKVARDRQIFVFATIEPSVSAYHLAVGPKGDLFATGPTTSSFDSVYRIDPHGAVIGLLPRPGAPARYGIRSRRKPVCCRLSRRQARNRKDCAGWFCRPWQLRDPASSASPSPRVNLRSWPPPARSIIWPGMCKANL